MHKIDGRDNVDGKFTDASLDVNGQLLSEATELTHDWANSVQEEIVNTVSTFDPEATFTDKENNSQMGTVLNNKFLNGMQFENLIEYTTTPGISGIVNSVMPPTEAVPISFLAVIKRCGFI